MLYLVQEWKLINPQMNDVALQILSFPVMDRLIRTHELCVNGRSFPVEDPDMRIKTSVMREMVFSITYEGITYDQEAKPGYQAEAFVDLYSLSVSPLRRFLSER
jgi:hypothetical protein